MALEKIDSAEIMTKLLEKSDLDIYRSDIFLLARKLMVRHSQKLTHPLTRKSLPEKKDKQKKDKKKKNKDK